MVFFFVIVCLLSAMNCPSDLSGRKIIIKLTGSYFGGDIIHTIIGEVEFGWGHKTFKLPLFCMISSWDAPPFPVTITTRIIVFL